MTEDNRSNDRGQLWLWVLVGLAILATIIMLLTDSNVGLKIALIAALWAAAIGAFMVGRYRNDKLAAERELELANQAHAAELKAHAAELENSKTSRELARAQEGLPVVDSDLLQEIKDEIAALRTQLEVLAGREWGYEPAALQAEARRVRELQAKTDAVGAGSTKTNKPLIDDTPVDSELVPEEETRKKAAAKGRDYDSVPRPSTVDTTELGVVEDSADDSAKSDKSGEADGDEPRERTGQDSREAQPTQAARPAAPTTPRAPSPEAVAGRVGGYEQPTNRESNPLSQLISERREEAAEPKKSEAKESEAKKSEANESEAKKSEARKPAPMPAPKQGPKAERQAEPVVDKPTEGRRGRRRRDENTDGISVAELLARAKKADQE